MARDLAIDLGTANTLVYERGRGIVLNEPTVIALNTRTREVLAMGHDAWQMIGRTPSDIVAERPLRQGAITDFDVTQRMIRLLLHRVRVGRFNRPRVVVCVPSAITEVERRAVAEAARRAGRHRRLPHRPAHGGGHRVGPAHPRAGRQPGHRRGRRHHRDRAHLARRGRRASTRCGSAASTSTPPSRPTCGASTASPWASARPRRSRSPSGRRGRCATSSRPRCGAATWPRACRRRSSSRRPRSARRSTTSSSRSSSRSSPAWAAPRPSWPTT